jgi:molybdopterin converting factor small subunit
MLHCPVVPAGSVQRKFNSSCTLAIPSPKWILPIDAEALTQNEEMREVRVKVLLYGPLADALGRYLEFQAADDCSIGQLRDHLGRMHPNAARSIDRSRAIIANVVVGESHRIAATDEIELLPPVSGG